jgi:RHS repeat-associated protein
MGPVQQFVAMAGGPLINRGFAPQMMSASVMAPWIVMVLVLFVLMLLRGHPSPNTNHHPLSTLSHAFFTTLSDFHINRWGKVLSLLLAFIFFIQMPSMAYAQAGGQLQQIVGDVDYFVYYQDDHLGSSSIITEGKTSARHSGLVYKKGEVLQRFEYSPFGNSRYVLNPTLSFDPSYTGQAYDGDTGLYYYKSRFYDPRLGRFVQPDTIVPQAKNLQAYNRYAYVSNNPLKYVDPTGHIFWFAGLAIGVLFGAYLGAVMATITGGNVGLGALTGAISGAIFFGAGQFLSALPAAIQKSSMMVLIETATHAVAGAMSGAINSAITKGNIGLGALIGGVSGGAGEFFGGKLPENKFFAQLAGRTSIGAVTGGVVGEIYGGNFWTGFKYGAFTSAAGFLFNQVLHELGRLDYNGKTVRNPHVRDELAKLRAGLNSEGYENVDLIVTGGESYYDTTTGQSVSLTDGNVIPNRGPGSAHHIGNGARDVDLRRVSIPDADFRNLVTTHTNFNRLTNAYGDGHWHLGLPRTYSCPPGACTR